MNKQQLLNDFIDKIYSEFGIIYNKVEPTIFDYPHVTKPWKERLPKYLLKGLAKEYLKNEKE